MKLLNLNLLAPSALEGIKGASSYLNLIEKKGLVAVL